MIERHLADPKRRIPSLQRQTSQVRIALVWAILYDTLAPQITLNINKLCP